MIINYLNNKKRKIIRLEQFDRNFYVCKEIGEFLKIYKNKKSQNVDIQEALSSALVADHALKSIKTKNTKK